MAASPFVELHSSLSAFFAPLTAPCQKRQRRRRSLRLPGAQEVARGQVPLGQTAEVCDAEIEAALTGVKAASAHLSGDIKEREQATEKVSALEESGTTSGLCRNWSERPRHLLL